jgi:hypothetical protein
MSLENQIEELKNELGRNHIALMNLQTEKDKRKSLTQGEENELQFRVQEAERLKKLIDDLEEKHLREKYGDEYVKTLNELKNMDLSIDKAGLETIKKIHELKEKLNEIKKRKKKS